MRYQYDGAGRQLSAQHTLTADGTGSGTIVGTLAVSQTYDAGGRMLTRRDPNGNPMEAEYDAAGRMILQRFPDGTKETHAYDAVGNLIRKVDASGTQLDMHHDLLGRMIRVLAYDHRGRLARVERSASGKAVTFAYDVLDRVVRMSEESLGLPQAASVREERFYHGWKVIEERDHGDGTTYTYVHGDIGILQRASSADASQLYYFHNAQETVVATVERSRRGTLRRERYEYQDYGAPVFVDALGQVRAQSLFHSDYLFASMRWLAEPGLYDVRARYPDPLAGRFLTLDTSGTAITIPRSCGAGLARITADRASSGCATTCATCTGASSTMCSSGSTAPARGCAPTVAPLPGRTGT